MSQGFTSQLPIPLPVAQGGTGLTTTANSAIFTTNSSGVPGWTASLTNGQILIGSTGATPAPSTITAGTGITITNGAGTISIAATTASTFYVNTANTSIGALAVVKYSNVVNDSAAGYSVATGLYTIPTTGWYIVNANIKTTSYNYGASAIVQINLYQNATIIAQQLITPAAYNATGLGLNLGTVYYFTAGNTVSIQAFSNIGGGGGTTLDSSVINFLSINYLHA